MQKALEYADKQFDTFVDELTEFLRIPSVSTDPARKQDVRRAADWLAEHLKEIGVEGVQIMETAGHPVVYGEHLSALGAPTVLVYGHYDVQPPDPLDLWESPPFEPVLKNGNLVARGSADDKGQLFMHVKAAEAYLKTQDSLPVNIKYLFEGEEEIGSKNLVPFLDEHKGHFGADVVVISDTALFGSGVPSITYGLRGLAYAEVMFEGPGRDLHSGIYGGAIENPINALARVIAGLHDDEHRVTIEGFYDNALPMTKEERRTYAELPFDEEEWVRETGATRAKTEKGYSALEATTARPVLDCCGIWGGFTGEGAKTVLPSRAYAKVSCRLVPNQTPDEMFAKLRKHFEKHVPPTMKMTFTNLHGGYGALTDTSSPAMKAASDAMEGVYGEKPFFFRSGGSIPIVSDFKRILGLETVLLGFGLDSDAIHSPNEKFGLDRFRAGIQTIVRFLDAYSRAR